MMHKLSLPRLKRHWLWLFVNGVGLTLAVRTSWMVIAAPQVAGWVLFTNSSALRDVVLFSGKSGLILLVLSLACTPVARVLGWNAALQVRKSLGLWGFGFACFHSLFFLQGKQLFIGMNIGPELWQALLDVYGIVRYGSKVPYAEAGGYALILLIPLALTSNRLAMRRLGKNWKRLHRLVYLAVPVAVYHYWWRINTEFPVPPPPDYWQPILFAVVVGLLLIVRFPPLRRWLAGAPWAQGRLDGKRLWKGSQIAPHKPMSSTPGLATHAPHKRSSIADPVHVNGHVTEHTSPIRRASITNDMGMHSEMQPHEGSQPEPILE